MLYWFSGYFLTIVIILLEVHVHNATAENWSHLVTIDGLNFGEFTGLNIVASVLGKEQGDVEVFELLDNGFIARFLVGRVTAPGIDVITPEINGFFGLSAVEVVSHVFADIGIIIGGISDTHGAVILLLDVGLHITNSSLDIGAGFGVGLVVGDFVTGKETDDIGVGSEFVDNGGVAFIEIIVPLGVVTVDGGCRLSQIGNNVDASIVKEFHTLLVILLRVDGIDTDGVGVEFLQERDITFAGLDVGERVLVLGLVFGSTIARPFLCRASM